ncbi:hypothetical protein Goklo_000059 [Gossypium klotzschianum]|uniref:Uncharacterized protein n=1 Tax=Gossypium klotzschianum TaxID=34286 RepID=A0A7J8W3L6_9ROSI|nr:hypothetical protein [Gossypium klotzschianum]
MEQTFIMIKPDGVQRGLHLILLDCGLEMRNLCFLWRLLCLSGW